MEPCCLEPFFVKISMKRGSSAVILLTVAQLQRPLPGPHVVPPHRGIPARRPQTVGVIVARGLQAGHAVVHVVQDTADFLQGCGVEEAEGVVGGDGGEAAVYGDDLVDV